MWDSGSGSEGGRSAARRRADTGRAKADTHTSRGRAGPRPPTGLKNRETPSLPGRILRGLLRFLKSPDELAFAFLFLFFVYWGIQWMIMIFR